MAASRGGAGGFLLFATLGGLLGDVGSLSAVIIAGDQ